MRRMRLSARVLYSGSNWTEWSSDRPPHRFPPGAIAALLSHDLDVILRFGFNILRGEVLTSARYGIWSFHHGDNEFYRGGPPLFWEVVEDNPCSGDSAGSDREAGQRPCHV